MTRPRAATDGSADVTTPFGRARLRGRVPHAWFFIIAAVGLFGTIGFAIDHAAEPEWVLWAPAPAYVLLFYLIRSYTGLVRTHGDALGSTPPRRAVPPPAD
jgi:hypothetical protein